MGMVNLRLGMLPDRGTRGLEGWSLSAEEREKILEREPERTLAARRLSIPSSQQLLENWPNFISTMTYFIVFALEFEIEIIKLLSENFEAEIFNKFNNYTCIFPFESSLMIH